MVNRLLSLMKLYVVGKLQIRMNPFRSERYVITIQVGESRYKILQVVFGHKDGSLFINFPYYQHTEGLVSVATLEGGKGHTNKISLVPGGKVTSHMVKYSHHPDGMTLFSQTGRVLSEVRKKSIALAQQEGHIFTTQFQHLKAFDEADKVKDNNKYDPKRTVINFSFGNEEPEAIKIVGRWYALEELVRRTVVNDGKTKVFGPQVPCITDAGKRYVGFLLSPKMGNPVDKFALLLICEGIPKLSKTEKTCLTFIGGFDPPEIINNLEVDTTMMALSYPASNYDELRKSIGSIDRAKE